jgi:hypothetical protein
MGAPTLTPAVPSAGMVRTTSRPAATVVKRDVKGSRSRLPSVSAASVPMVTA